MEALWQNPSPHDILLVVGSHEQFIGSEGNPVLIWLVSKHLSLRLQSPISFFRVIGFRLVWVLQLTPLVFGVSIQALNFNDLILSVVSIIVVINEIAFGFKSSWL